MYDKTPVHAQLTPPQRRHDHEWTHPLGTISETVQPLARAYGRTKPRNTIAPNGPTAVFLRRFTLPEDVDGNKVAAEYKDGILNVHLPKSEKAQPKSIEVTVA